MYTATIRINEVKKQMEQTPEMKKLVDGNPEYVNTIKGYSFDKLMEEHSNAHSSHSAPHPERMNFNQDGQNNNH